MVDRSVPMRVEESNQCESPISIARERSSYSKRFMKLLQDFHHLFKNWIFWVWTQKCPSIRLIIRSVKSADSRIIDSQTRIPSRGVRSPIGPVFHKMDRSQSGCTMHGRWYFNRAHIWHILSSSLQLKIVFLLSRVSLSCYEARPREPWWLNSFTTPPWELWPASWGSGYF